MAVPVITNDENRHGNNIPSRVSGDEILSLSEEISRPSPQTSPILDANKNAIQHTRTFSTQQSATLRTSSEITSWPSIPETRDPQPVVDVRSSTLPQGSLAIDIVNKLDCNNMKAYIEGRGPNGNAIMLGQDGSWVNLKESVASSTTPVPIPSNVELIMPGANQTLNLMTPGYISSARIWISEGSLKFSVTPDGGFVQPAAINPHDPNNDINYAFGEFNWDATSGVFADITYVDFVGLPIGMELMYNLDNQTYIQSALGPPANAAPALCDLLKQQDANNTQGPRWSELCVHDAHGDLIRVLSPTNAIGQDASSLRTAFDGYVDQVWSHYATNKLTINAQNYIGNVTCQVDNSTQLLNCQNDNRGYPKPTTADILGCSSGTFAIQNNDGDIHRAVVARLCAAFHRATFLLPGGDVQPGPQQDSYYTSYPNNVYSKYTHAIEAHNAGYAFSYDDVALAWDDNTAGTLAASEPKLLTVFVGGA